MERHSICAWVKPTDDASAALSSEGSTTMDARRHERAERHAAHDERDRNEATK